MWDFLWPSVCLIFTCHHFDLIRVAYWRGNETVYILLQATASPQTEQLHWTYRRYNVSNFNFYKWILNRFTFWSYLTKECLTLFFCAIRESICYQKVLHSTVSSRENRILNLNIFSLGCVQVSFSLSCLFYMQQFLRYLHPSQIKLIKPNSLKPVITFSQMRIRRHVITACLTKNNYLVCAMAPWLKQLKY